MSEELTTVEVADEIKAVMEDENFVPSPEDIECYGKHQIKPSEILPCPFCGSEYLQFGDWGTHGKVEQPPRRGSVAKANRGAGVETQAISEGVEEDCEKQ